MGRRLALVVRAVAVCTLLKSEGANSICAQAKWVTSQLLRGLLHFFQRLSAEVHTTPPPLPRLAQQHAHRLPLAKSTPSLQRHAASSRWFRPTSLSNHNSSVATFPPTSPSLLNGPAANGLAIVARISSYPSPGDCSTWITSLSCNALSASNFAAAIL